MYGKGTEIDKIRESATIDTSFDISRPNVVNTFKFSEHVLHVIDNTHAKFQLYRLRLIGITCIAAIEKFS